MSDYDQQSGEMSDWLNGPSVTPEEAVHPGFWGGLSPFAPIQGVASGTLEVGSVLAKGLPWLTRTLAQPTDIGLTGPEIERQDVEHAQGPQPEQHLSWERPLTEWSNQVSDEARAGAKAALPDPRLTGTAANIVLGSTKLMTEATAMTALSGGNPFAGAAGVGAIQGVARYQDYRDQGVDDATAQKLALVQSAAAGAGMLIPGGLSAKWLANLTPARQVFSELATGAASNVIQGGANRYVTSKILDDAGYHDLAEQSKVLDGEAIFTDLLTGGGFGMLHYLHNRSDIAAAARELARQDSTVADSARVAQDAQQIVERAPGVPVDMKSQAVHRAALEKATEQLLKDEPVDVGGITAPEVQTPAAVPSQEAPLQQFLSQSPISGWLKDQISDNYRTAQQRGIVDRVLQSLSEGRTGTEVANELRSEGAAGRDVDTKMLVNAVRAVHDVPAMDEPDAFRAWQERFRRAGSPREATFARPAEDTRPMREVLHDEFKKAGVMDEWSKLEDLNDLLESKYEPPSVKPRESLETELPISETEAVPPEEGGYSVKEEALTDEQREAFEGLRSHIPADEELSGSSEGVPGRSGDSDDGGSREGAPLRVYRGSDRELLPEHFDEGSLGKASGHPSSGLGVFFTNDKDDAAHYGPVVTSHHLDIRNPKRIGPGDLPAFDSVEEATQWRNKLREQGYDGITLDYSGVGGPVQHVAFGPDQVKRANEPGDLALSNAKTLADKVKDEAPKLFSAAADCATRTR